MHLLTYEDHVTCWKYFLWQNNVYIKLFSGKRCPLEEQQEQEKAKLKEENDETKVEFVPKNDEEQSKDKITDKKRPSLIRAMVYQFGPQFLIGMILKLIYDVIQFIQPQLVKWV